ncbi:MAG: hypothetical protein IKL84_04860 [Clostridia bacterium]|nr:hypothetical protein [Clostridia bacterium]
MNWVLRPPWLVSLFNPERGGFYAASSGKADSALRVRLEMSGYVLIALQV